MLVIDLLKILLPLLPPFERGRRNQPVAGKDLHSVFVRPLRGTLAAEQVRRNPSKGKGFRAAIQEESREGYGILDLTHRADSTAATVVIDDESVTFDDTIHGQIAAVACIRDFAILKDLDRHLDCIYGAPSTFEDCHCRLASVLARSQMQALILDTVVASAGVHEDRPEISSSPVAGGERCHIGDSTAARSASWTGSGARSKRLSGILMTCVRAAA